MRGPLDRGWRHCIVVASGPSAETQFPRIEQAQRDGWRIFVANSTWRRLPSADVLFGSDRGFWNRYIREIRAGFRGELWTGDIAGAKAHRLQRVSLRYEADRASHLFAGLSKMPGTIRHHGNTGAHTLLLAHQFGAERIILAGFDFQLTGGTRNAASGLLEGGPIHHHGPHPARDGKTPGLSNPTPESFVRWGDRLAIAARDLASAGVVVLNASGETALTCFERAPLDAALARLA